MKRLIFVFVFLISVCFISHIKCEELTWKELADYCIETENLVIKYINNGGIKKKENLVILRKRKEKHNQGEKNLQKLKAIDENDKKEIERFKKENKKHIDSLDFRSKRKWAEVFDLITREDFNEKIDELLPNFKALIERLDVLHDWGEIVKVGDFTYSLSLNIVEDKEIIAMDKFTPNKKSEYGCYVRVSFEITNNGKKAKEIPHIILVDLDENEFEETYIRGDENILIGGEKVNPSLSKKGNIYFDIPLNRYFNVKVADDRYHPKSYAYIGIINLSRKQK